MTEQTKTILLVEDEAPAALVLSKALEAEGFAVTIAPNGVIGLEKALSLHPDIILSDLKLPFLGGMDMIREIRKDSWGAHAEIIILTDVSDVKTIEEAMGQETFFFIVKGDTSLAEIVTKVRSRYEAIAATKHASN